MEFSRFCTFNEIKFLNKSKIFVQYTHFSIEFSRFGKFFDFPSNFHEFVHSTNSNFFYKSVRFVCLMFKIFHRIFTILYIQRIQCLKYIHTTYTSILHNFPLNFHDFVLSTKSNFLTSPNYWYILCTQFSIEFSRFGTFIDFPSNFHEFIHLMNSNFFTNPNDLYIKCTEFSIEFSRFCIFNENKFVNKSGLFVHLTYTIFN